MSLIFMDKPLPDLPEKRYFTIGEVSELCGVKPYVLRYWEQEFTQLKPMKRRGNRRYYQPHEVLLIRRIRGLLYEEGFTISGARNRLADDAPDAAESAADHAPDARNAHGAPMLERIATSAVLDVDTSLQTQGELTLDAMRSELISLRSLLSA